MALYGNDERHTKNSPKSGRGLGQVTVQSLAYDRTYLQNYFELVTW